MGGTGFIVDILLVLVLAKVAAEVAERIGMPAVVGEILAGVIAGPSLLGWVDDGEVLRALGEIGVILLLLEVGLEMDLKELSAVGRAALLVAVAGVVVPFAGGAGVGIALGMTTNEAIFVGAALTATSVGITARVFGDLRALASVEARTVLGAAVADDVLGLVILTVVVRLVEAGSVSAFDVGEVVLVAVAFLVVATVVGLRLVPPLFGAVARAGRSNGTLIGLAIAFTLAMAEFASLAKLAPIIGAFIAGICLAESPVRRRLAGELGPISHVFVPVFFFGIGIDADLGQFTRLDVLGLAAILFVVAVAGKMAAALVMGRAPGDRLLIGLGMLPRGEVGLIFATIGLQQGVFGDDVYAALLLVVLATTLLAPPLLRARLVHNRMQVSGEEVQANTRPPDGWLVVERGVVELAARPPVEEAAEIVIEAALHMETTRPGEELLGWIDGLPAVVPIGQPRSQAAFGRLLGEGGPRSWRFLLVSGFLRRLLPELDAAVGRRFDDPYDPDPMGALNWPRVDALHPDGRIPSLVLGLAALVLDATGGATDDDARTLARALATKLGLGPNAVQRVVALVGDADLLVGMAHRLGIREGHVRELAIHIVDRGRLVELAELTAASPDLDRAQRAGVDELVENVDATLGETGGEGLTSVTGRMEAAEALVSGAARDRVRSAPSTWVLRVPVEELAHQSARAEPAPEPGSARVEVRVGPDDSWLVTVIARDQMGLLARCSRVLAAGGLDVIDADVATWPDGLALTTFGVRSFVPPDADRIAAELDRATGIRIDTEPLPTVELSFDQQASPWHTVCRVLADDRFGLLGGLAAAFASAGADIEAARISTVDGQAVDIFELTGPGDRKLTGAEMTAIRVAVTCGVSTRRRTLRRGWALVPSR